MSAIDPKLAQLLSAERTQEDRNLAEWFLAASFSREEMAYELAANRVSNVRQAIEWAISQFDVFSEERTWLENQLAAFDAQKDKP